MLVTEDPSGSPAHGADTSADQTIIWRHFQTHAAGVFHRNRPRLDAQIAYVLKHCRRDSGACVVNVGPGNGYLEDRCRELGLRVISIDPDTRTVEAMQARGHVAHAAYLDALPLPDASVQCLVASEVLEHIPEAALAGSLAEVRRVLAPGGMFVGTVPHAERLEDNQVVCPHCAELFHRWGHQQSFTPQRLRGLLLAVGPSPRVVVRGFVDWRRRSPAGLFKSLVRAVAARLGWGIASPNIQFRVTRG
ncbi:MAG: class I SAM-dependent methyltransferase [Pseudomonadales bacterium]|nr:class I SAM-dependent methyltransferase [Pseudomonadales bacterium]MCP5186028.1 class I SAM-dependent methyltransferase [Pseudomonadales bacterium]